MSETSATLKYSCLILIICVLSISCNVKNSLPDPLEAGWKGEPVCELIHEDDEMRILRCTFEPGVGHEKHYHKPHYGYVLSGSRFQIRDENGVREVEMETGNGFHSTGVKWHEALNIGDSTGIFLIIEPK